MYLAPYKAGSSIDLNELLLSAKLHWISDLSASPARKGKWLAVLATVWLCQLHLQNIVKIIHFRLVKTFKGLSLRYPAAST